MRNGRILEGLPEFDERFHKLTGQERIKSASMVDPLPAELRDRRFVKTTDGEVVLESASTSADLTMERAIESDEDEEAAEEEKKTTEQLWRDWSIAERVAAATLGNKAIRTLAMREPNRTIALAAATSPAITEQEIIAAAASRTVHSDVIHHIVHDRKNNWVRLYPVKSALVNNPKTPLPDAMKLVPHMNQKDMKRVSKSKNVSAGVRNSPTSS
ncbi:MAG: hypothetical protein HC923_09510 [Myxococcales bacterium]|nr:hypothetical protein [Myxococcales bacterium]